MKKTYLLVMFALLVTTLFACKKDKGDKDDPKKDLVSIWELAEASSAMMPVKTYEPGNGNLLRIYSSGTYAYYQEDKQVGDRGTYSITADNSVEENVCLIDLKDKYKTRIDFESEKFGPPMVYVKTFFYTADNKLFMIGGCYAVDAGSLRVYRRANPKPL